MSDIDPRVRDAMERRELYFPVERAWENVDVVQIRDRVPPKLREGDTFYAPRVQEAPKIQLRIRGSLAELTVDDAERLINWLEHFTTMLKSEQYIDYVRDMNSCMFLSNKQVDEVVAMPPAAEAEK